MEITKENVYEFFKFKFNNFDDLMKDFNDFIETSKLKIMSDDTPINSNVICVKEVEDLKLNETYTIESLNIGDMITIVRIKETQNSYLSIYFSNITH